MPQPNGQYKPIPAPQIAELSAIYDDFMRMVREHENLLRLVPLDVLASWQLDDMYSDSPEGWKFGWHITYNSPDARHRFNDCINDDAYGNDNSVFVILEHIKPEDNSGASKFFAIPPYTITTVDMQLPSPIDRSSFIYRPDVKLGKTKFYIDGIYEVTYVDKDFKNKPLSECLRDPNILTEISVMLAVCDTFRKNNYVADNKFDRMSANVYAAEKVASNEDIILELLGSFAEKFQNVCRDRYNVTDTGEALKLAKSEGLIDSADDFQDYINIRQLMRHRWDTLDGLGVFGNKKQSKSQDARAGYEKSYLKLCDNTLVQRMKCYVDVLHQMQRVIRNICPNRIMRDLPESNNKFIQRIKTIRQQNPTQTLAIEINHPWASVKYDSLNRNLRKLVPNITIIDDIVDPDYLDVYGTRSWFLQTFHSMECMIMQHCKSRGHDMRTRDALDYLRQINLLSTEEYYTWHNYKQMRNLLSHNYFNKTLQAMLTNIEDAYRKDLSVMSDKLVAVGPDVKKIRPGVYEFTHQDGMIVQRDFNTNKIEYKKRNNETTPEPATTVIRSDVYANGTKFKLSSNKIVEVKLPNSISINLETQCIHWDKYTTLIHTPEGFTLSTRTTQISTDHDLRVIRYSFRNNMRPFRAGDNILVDNRHNVALDAFRKLKSFKFKDSGDTIIRAEFTHTRNDWNIIQFSDGTSVSQSGDTMIVRHNGITMQYDNRPVFAATYNLPQPTPQPINSPTKSH